MEQWLWQNLKLNPGEKCCCIGSEDGYFVVEVPSLPGCISQGKTREEALANIEEVIALYVEVLQESGEPVPDDRVEVVLV